MKLGIGTAQFGLDYGISNEAGQTTGQEVKVLLRRAYDEGVRVLDTAPAYGCAERRLGELAPQNADFAYVTKTVIIDDAALSANARCDRMERAFQQSLRHLGVARAYGLLVHRATDLLDPGGQALFDRLQTLRESGSVKKIGASVYTAQEVEQIMQRFDIDLVQIPVSVLDRRLVDNGLLRHLAERGVEVHARSIFLQGLMLMAPQHIPNALAPLREPVSAFQRCAADQGLSPLAAALGFVQSLADIKHVICGVNSLAQFDHLLAVSEQSVDPGHFCELDVGDPHWLDPSNWPTLPR